MNWAKTAKHLRDRENGLYLDARDHSDTDRSRDLATQAETIGVMKDALIAGMTPEETREYECLCMCR